MEVPFDLVRWADEATKVLIKGITSVTRVNVVLNHHSGKVETQPESRAPHMIHDRMLLETELLLRASETIRKDIEQQVAAIRRERNKLISTIFTLPIELLSEIFALAAHATDGLFIVEYPRSEYGNLPRTLTEVCFLWNKVAVSTPKIWTTLCSHFKLSQVRCFIDRSKSSSLDIWFRRENGPFLALILPQIHRWRKFACWSDQVLHAMDEHFCQPNAPQLEAFTISPSNSRDSSNQNSSDQVRPLMLFGGQAPRLRALDISSRSPFTVSWDSNILSRLEYIRIGDLFEEDQFPIGTKYHRLFQSLPFLQSACIYSFQPTNHPALQSIALERFYLINHPNLSCLDLTDLPAAVVLTISSFLSSLSPHLRYIRASGCTWGLLDPTTSLAQPDDCSLRLIIAQIRRLRITLGAGDGDGIYIRGLGRMEGWDYYKTHIRAHDPRTLLQFDFESGGHQLLPTLLSVILPSTGVYTRIQSLRIHGTRSSPLSIVDLPDRFQMLPALEELG